MATLPFKDPWKPQRLCEEDHHFSCMDRDGSFKDFFDFILQRYANRDRDKAYNSLNATQSSRGGGKSYFLSQLAKLDPNDIDKFLLPQPQKVEKSDKVLPFVSMGADARSAYARERISDEQRRQMYKNWRVQMQTQGKGLEANLLREFDRQGEEDKRQEEEDTRQEEEEKRQEEEDKLHEEHKQPEGTQLEEEDKLQDKQEEGEDTKPQKQVELVLRLEEQARRLEEQAQRLKDQAVRLKERRQKEQDRRVDEVIRRREESCTRQVDVMKRAYHKAKFILKNSVAVCIAFNYATTVDSRYDTCASIAMGMRMLYSTFVDSSQCTYRSFCEKCQQATLQPDFYNALSYIKETVSPNIFLCVDEITKLSAHNDPRDNIILEALRAIGDTLCGDENFNAIVSTIDVRAINHHRSLYDCTINYVALPPLSTTTAITQILPCVTLSYSALQVMRLVLADQNGHPASLVVCKKYFMEKSPVVIAGNYDQIMSDLVARSRLEELDITVVQAALRGKLVQLADHIGLQRFGSLIACGAYVNTLSTQDDVYSAIPTLSPFMLMAFSKKRDIEDTSEIVLIKICLLQMLSFDGLAYEKFHAWWELLFRLLTIDNRKSQSLINFYGVTEDIMFI